MSFKRDLLVEQGYDDTVLLEPQYLDEAIIGVSHDGRAVYDYDLLVQAFTSHDSMTEEEAIEWIDYNTIRSLSYVQNSPIVMNKIE